MKKYFLLLYLFTTINNFASPLDTDYIASLSEGLRTDFKIFFSTSLGALKFLCNAVAFGMDQVYPKDLYYEESTSDSQEDTAFLEIETSDSVPFDTHQDLCPRAR
jgi:hypothetical protein